MLLYLWIAAGSALGGVGRFALARSIDAVAGSAFPWGTLIVNVTGSFAIGFFYTLTQPNGRWEVGSTGRHFFMVGICGGYTTFSSFSLQTVNLAREGEWMRAGGNVVGSVVLCLVAAWLGHVAASALSPSKAS